MDLDWRRWPNFTLGEMRCKHTGLCAIKPEFMDTLQELRRRYGRPMIVTSGYRHPTHPVERIKAQPGTHTMGLAVDIAANGQQAYEIFKIAYDLGFSGLGLARTFVHLDLWLGGPRPNMWIYS